MSYVDLGLCQCDWLAVVYCYDPCPARTTTFSADASDKPAPKEIVIGYSTPHVAREYFFAACLRVCHQYVLAFQRIEKREKRRLLQQTREIDLCAKLADFFGPNAYLAAQGAKEVDLQVKGPTIQAEVKYFRPPANQWLEQKCDWNWLLDLSSVNDNFTKNAWIVFFPSTSLFNFTQCLSVTKTKDKQFVIADYVPFAPLVEPYLPATGSHEQLKYKTERAATTIISVRNGKKVRADVVGKHSHPVWCVIYSRITSRERDTLVEASVQEIIV